MLLVKRSQNGFTLIELMIAIGIIGVIASVAIPQFLSFRLKAFNTAATSDLKNVSLTMESFYSEANAYPNGTSATGPNTLTLTNNTATLSVTLSQNVHVAIGNASNNAKRCMLSKHLTGNTIMYANTDALHIASHTPTAADVGLILHASSAWADAQALACSIN